MSVKNSQFLKSLQSQRDKEEAKLPSLREAVKVAREELSRVANRVAKLNQDIESLTDKEITISEHAILRYIERTGEIDTDHIRARILPEQVKHQAQVLGDGNYPIGEGCRIVVKGNTVVTVTTNKEKEA